MDFNLSHWSLLKWFPLFLWLLIALSSVSNFRPDTGGQSGLLFRFASSVQSCCGEGGALQADIAVCGEHSLCVGSTHRVPATLGLPRTGVSVLSLSALLRLPAALYGAGPVECGSSFRVLHNSADSVAPACCFPRLSDSGSQGLGRPPSGCGMPFPSAPSGPGSQSLGRTHLGFGALFPPRPQRAPPVGSQEVFRQEPGPVCRVGGGGFSRAEFAPFPSPCLFPPAGMGRLFSRVWQCVRAG